MQMQHSPLFFNFYPEWLEWVLFSSLSTPNDSNGFTRAQYKARKEPTPWYQSRGEEFTPLYEPYSYMLPLRVWFLHRFGLKTGIEFAHLDLESVMFFLGNYESVWTYLSFQLQMNKKERIICEFEINFKNSFY